MMTIAPAASTVRRSQRSSGRSCQRSLGFTLVEMIITTTLLLTVAVIGFRLLGLMLRLDQRSTVGTGTMLVLDRLTERFRNDVHHATGSLLQQPLVGTDTAYQQVELQVAGKTVIYTVSTIGIERTIPGPSPQRPIERDLFRLDGCQAMFVAAGPVLRLEIDTDPEPRPEANLAGTPTFDVTIDAAIARGRQL